MMNGPVILLATFFETPCKPKVTKTSKALVDVKNLEKYTKIDTSANISKSDKLHQRKVHMLLQMLSLTLNLTLMQM